MPVRLGVSSPANAMPVALGGTGATTLEGASVLAITPVIGVIASGAAQTLTARANGNIAFDITLTANCTLTLAGGTAGQEQRVTAYLRQASGGGFVTTLPSNVLWTGGTPPSLSTNAGALYRIVFTTPDAGATWFAESSAAAAVATTAPVGTAGPGVVDSSGNKVADSFGAHLLAA